MTKIWRNMFLVLLLLAPCLIQMSGMMVRGEEEEADVVVEEDSTTEEVIHKAEDNEEEESSERLKAHPDAVTSILFVKPLAQSDIPAGREATVVVGLSNEGDRNFVVNTLEASIRYSQDFSYHIQNFTTYNLEMPVDGGKEASFEYRFTPSESLSSRPFGLVISVNYKDEDGNAYTDAVFNSTVNISEPDEGVDGEMVFMYIFLVVIVVMAVVGATQLLSSIKKKHMGSGKAKQVMEMGTQNKADVDYDWLPDETLQELKKSPKPSPVLRSSPRQRNIKRDE